MGFGGGGFPKSGPTNIWFPTHSENMGRCWLILTKLLDILRFPLISMAF